MRYNFIEGFQRDAMLTPEFREAMPGLLGVIAYPIDRLMVHRFHFLIDPRARGCTFKGVDGYTPIMRLDWELDDKALEEITTVRELICLANEQVVNDLDEYQSGHRVPGQDGA